MTTKHKSNQAKCDKKSPNKKINKVEIKILKDIIKQFSDNPMSCEFREPVNYQALGLMDYPEIIKKPMDLKTLEENLITGKYNTILSALEDLNLIWKNCQDYNHEDSEISELATEFSRRTKRLVRKHFPDQVDYLYPKSKPSKMGLPVNHKNHAVEETKGKSVLIKKGKNQNEGIVVREKDPLIEKKVKSEMTENKSLGEGIKDSDLKDEEARLLSNKINGLPMNKLAEIISLLFTENSNAIHIKDKHFVILVKQITFNQMKKLLIVIDGQED